MAKAASRLIDVEREGSTDISDALDPPTYVTDGRYEQPRSAPENSSRPSLGGPHFGDSSGPLVSMYSTITEDADNKGADRCQRDAEAIMVFSGLFSAAVATLLSVSIPDLRPKDTSSFYLESIHHLLAAPDNSRVAIPSTVAKPPPFSAPTYAIWVNSLWFLSLVISLTTATMALSLQEWARRYIRITQQPRSNPEMQARIRAVIANGLEKRFLLWGGDGLATYLHLSVFLFFVGAVIFVYNINHVVFGVVVLWLGYSTLGYMFFTLMPIFRSDVLLYTPLSRLLLPVCRGVSHVALRVGSSIPPLYDSCDDIRKLNRDLRDRWNRGLLGSTRRAVEETASKPSPKMDTLIVERMLLNLSEDQTLEQFFDAIPGYCNSPLANGRLPCPAQVKFQQALDGFLDRTLSSNSISEIVRSRRFVICLDAARAALGFDGVKRIFNDILNGRWNKVFQSVEIGHSLRRWGDEQFFPYVRRIVPRIISRVPERDDRWIGLVKLEFGIPDRSLREYLQHGDSASLVILNHTTRQLFHSNTSCWDPDILKDVSNFDVNNTLPRLQQDFCALWNEIVQEAQKCDAVTTPAIILRKICHVHIALHQGKVAALGLYSDLVTDEDGKHFEPSLYSLCRAGGHCPDPTPHYGVAPERNITQPFSTTFPSPDVTSPHALYPFDACTLPAAESSFGSVLGSPPSFTSILTSSHSAPLQRQCLHVSAPDLAVADASRRNSDDPSHSNVLSVDTHLVPAHGSFTTPAEFAAACVENPLINGPDISPTRRTASLS